MFVLQTLIKVGGTDGSITLDTLWKLNTSTNTFEEKKYNNKEAHTAESYTSKEEYIYFTSNYSLMEFAMSSNPKFHTESALSPLHYADRPSITTDQTYLYLTGGIENKTHVVHKLSIYDVGGKQWISDTNLPRMNVPRIGHNCIARNNYLYIFGGYINDALNETTNTIEKLYIGDIDNISEQRWFLLNATLNDSIAFMRIAEVDGLIYVIGGYSAETNSSVNTVYVFDPNRDKVTNGIALSHHTSSPAVIVDADQGQVYIFGGYESWHSSKTMNITQISNKIHTSAVDPPWLEIVMFGVLGVPVLILACFCICYRAFLCYQNRKIIRSEGEHIIYRKSFSYGAAEGRSLEGDNSLRSHIEDINHMMVDTSFSKPPDEN